MKNIKYTEIFGGFGMNPTIQGEGKYTGVPSVFVRLAGCTLRCPGFGQKNPSDPSSYETQVLPDVETIDELPLITFGCDSIYSVDPKYKKFFKTGTVNEIVDLIEDCNRHPVFNPEGKFLHPKSNQFAHLIFTGGEPLLWQDEIVQILEELIRRQNRPVAITFETNGTVPLKSSMREFFGWYRIPLDPLFSVSPKLMSTSGEPQSKAFKQSVLDSFLDVSTDIQLKFVVNGSDQTWEEVDQYLAGCSEQVQDAALVTIMAVGSSFEQQMDIQAKICEQACHRGYEFSARVHSLIFGNSVGK